MLFSLKDPVFTYIPQNQYIKLKVNLAISTATVNKYNFICQLNYNNFCLFYYTKVCLKVNSKCW